LDISTTEEYYIKSSALATTINTLPYGNMERRLEAKSDNKAKRPTITIPAKYK